MTVDLNACTGCGACVVACQAENNIAVVGKDQVRRGRAMHWLRVDTYYQGSEDRSGDVQPAGAVHAVRERAVRAGVPGAGHVAQLRGPERYGLQPLRGHPLLLQQLPVQGAALQLLPVQRFRNAQLEAAAQSRCHGAQPRRDGKVHILRAAHQRRQDRLRAGGSRVRDGEIQTACQATCPAEAIVFGNINDTNSRVAKLKTDERNYGLLAELNTRPRTTYLATLRNPNPEIEA